MQNGQGKCIRYAMSHVTGKIEILGQMPDKNMLLNIIRQNMKRPGPYILREIGTWTGVAAGVIPDFAADCFPAHAGLCRRQMLSRGTYPNRGMSCGLFVP